MSDSSSVAVMCFSDNNGGMELDTIKLARLLGDDYRVSLFCRHGSFIHDRASSIAGLNVIPVRFLSRKFSLSMMRAVRRAIRQRGIRNVIFFGASELKTLYFSFYGLSLNVIVRHGTTKSRQKNSLIHRLVYSCVSYHVALSGHLLANVRYIVPKMHDDSYRVITPSHRIEGSCVNESGDDAIVITHVGRIARGKGQVEAVQACMALDRAGIDYRLKLVGPDSADGYAAELKDAIRAAGSQDRVELPGYMDDTLSVLRNTDIFLFPSYGEGMPNAFIEAMYCGIPCIAFANTVFPEFLSMGFYVKLAKDRDTEDLADKLLDTVNDIAEEKKQSSKNTALARECFSPERELAGWKSILI